MAARIDDEFMTAEFGGRVIATARYSSHAAADGQGAWIVSDHPRPLVHPEPGDHGHGASGAARRGLWRRRPVRDRVA